MFCKYLLVTLFSTWACWKIFQHQTIELLEPHVSVCDLIPYDLTVEHLSQRDLVTIEPDSPRAPRFSFKASSDTTPSSEAKASQVQVIRCNDNDNDNDNNCQDHQVVWDSGWILAGRRNGLDITRSRPLDGLIPMERLLWRARFGIEVEDKDIEACHWSKYESLLVGPSQHQWEQADWICAPNQIHTECDFYDTHGKAAAPLFRVEFDLGDGQNTATTSLKSIASARLFVTGLGHYEAWMNGVHINHDRYLDPAPSSYDKRVYYNSFDVTSVLVEGPRQTLGFLVGNGWFNPLPMKFWGQKNLREALTVGAPRVRAILHIDFLDSTREPVIITTSATTTNNTSWKVTKSSLLRNDLYLGNVVDLDRSRWLEGWSQVGFENPVIQWQPAINCADMLELPIPEPQPIPPIRSRPPYRLSAISNSWIDNDLVLDMGLNTAAAVNVEIFVPHDWVCSAQEINLKFGELLFPNGTVNVYTSVAGQIKEEGCCGTCAPALAYQGLVIRASKSGHFTTQFSWSAFRYIQISSLPPRWEITVTAIPLMTDVTWMSSFQSSNSLLNDIFDLCRNTHASNMMGMQSDCPHRERFGYTGDALATLTTSLAFFDVTAFYEKRLHDMEDSIRINGGVTETAPFVGISSNGFGEGSGPIGWQSFFPHVQLELYRHFGNKRALSDMRNATRRWMDLILSHPYEVEHGLGDWMATEPLPVAISGHIFLIRALRAWSKITDSDNERTNAIKRAHEELKQFNFLFISNDNGDVMIDGSHPTQSAQAMTLFYDLVERSRKELVIQGLVRAVEKSSRHITTGMFGVIPLFESLMMINRSDLAWDIATQRTYPSYGYMIDNNATTLWESWFLSNNTFSHNHPMFSGISSWLISHIGGIRVAKDAIGSDRLIFAVNPPVKSGLHFAKIALETARGKASCEWKCQTNGKMNINIRCPVNTRGVILLPHRSERIHIRGGHYRFQVSTELCEGETVIN